MRLLLPFTSLVIAAVALGQRGESPAGSRVIRPDVSQEVDPSAGALRSGTPFQLQGGLGFTALYFLLNREAWPTRPGSGRALRDGVSTVDLDAPLQAIVLFNSWHLRTARGEDDIRLADLRRNVFRPTLTFTPQWPDYSAPGYIVVVEKRNREWALIANVAGHYLVEDSGGIGFCRPLPD